MVLCISNGFAGHSVLECDGSQTCAMLPNRLDMTPLKSAKGRNIVL